MKSIITGRYLIPAAFLTILFFFACTDSKTVKDEQTTQSKTDSAGNTAPRDKTVEGSSSSLFIDDGGPSSGTPVVLVHSFGGSSSHWKAQLEHLRKSRRAIAFDLRGHGLSSIPSDSNYYVQSLAKDIEAVVDSLDLDKFILVGHSMGGSASIVYTMRNPERVAGLLLVGTPGKTPSQQAKPIIASLESEKYDTVMNDYMKRLLINARPSVADSVWKGIKKLNKSASVDIIKAVFEFDPVPPLSDYPGPKLIISSSGEEQPNALFKQLPEIPHKVISGTSHWVQMDKPDEFNRLLDEFIIRVENETRNIK